MHHLVRGRNVQPGRRLARIATAMSGRNTENAARSEHHTGGDGAVGESSVRVPDDREEAPPTAMSLTSFRRNVLWNAVFLVAQIAGLMWLTRYLVQNLGAEEFSLVPLSNSVVNFLTVVTVALSAGAARELTRALGEAADVSADRVFRTALWGGAALAGALAPAGVVLALVVSSVIRLPTNLRPDAMVLMLATLFGFLLAVASTAFGAKLFARNRLDLRSIASTAQLGVRLLAVWLLVDAGVGLIGVSASVAVGAVAGFGLLAFMSHRVEPRLAVRPVGLDGSQFRRMTGLGLWVSLDQVGTLLVFSTDVLLVNLLFGPTAAGVYGAIAVLCTAMRAGTSVIANALAPPVVDAYARRDLEAVTKYAASTTRVLGVLMALPAGVACGLSSDALGAWLGPAWSAQWPVLVVLVGPLPATLATTTLFSVQLGAGKVRVPGLVSLTLGVAMVILGVTMAWAWPTLGSLSIALAMAVTLVLRNVVILPAYTARVVGARSGVFVRQVAPAIVGTAMTAVLARVLAMGAGAVDLAWLVVLAFLVTVAYMPVAWIGLLTTRERTYLRRLVRRPA